jgi:hypothetical protein
MDKKIIQKGGKYFTETEKHQIIQELLQYQLTKQEIWEKYTGQKEEHGQLHRWSKTRRWRRTGRRMVLCVLPDTYGGENTPYKKEPVLFC